MVSSSPTGSRDADSTTTSSPDSFYDSDDSRVKCTVTPQGKIWAPVPIVPMAAALAAFEVHAFAVTLPSPMSVLVDSRSTGDRDGWAEKKSSVSTFSEQKIPDTTGSNMRRDRDIFVVFREDEDDVPAAGLGPREANGNPAPYEMNTTRSEMQGREEREDMSSAEQIPREVNWNPALQQTGPTAGSGDIVTEMKNLLRMEPGKAKNAMATRLFGGESSRRAAPNAPRVPTIPLPAPTSPALEDNYEDLYGALEPAAPQPSTHLDAHQLSLLRVLCRGY
ncbi:hypothetical protein FPV67DRAFT_1522973 [Lyophyllum atratum]|nr:hypothetical protein FPV67DRAFT_1522973 [Lyophyllum atratum]